MSTTFFCCFLWIVNEKFDREFLAGGNLATKNGYKQRYNVQSHDSG